MNRKERRAAQKRGGPATSPMAATLAQAFRAHQAGHRSDAERLYRDVLAVEPRNAAALHLLGALMHQSDRSDEAISLIRQAVAIDPQNPDYHYNLGLILLRTSRADDAIAHLKKAVELKSDYADAHFELGNAYARVERWPEAASQFRRAISLKPGDPSAQNNLALVLRQQGALHDAAALWERVVKTSPSFPLAQMNLGLAYKTMGRLADAQASLRSAIALQPKLAEGHYNLVSVLIEQNNAGQALETLRHVFELRDTIDTRRLFVRFATTCTQIPLDPQLEPLLLRALSEDWTNPQYLYALCRSYLGTRPAIEAALKQAESAHPDPLPLNQILGTADHLGTNRLLLELIASTPVADLDMERLLTRIRFSLLDAVRRLSETESLPGSVIELCCAIARQCFINEYIFNEAPEERSIVQVLISRVETALRNGRPVAPEIIAMIAAYQPLRATPLAERLAHYDAPAPLAPLLKQQIEEPLAEQALCEEIASLTPTGESVSQDEEHPGPRWVKTSRLTSPVPIDRFLQDAFPQARFKPLGKAGTLEILIAGCGTGLDAITASQTISAANILAVDPSVANLAFAERQTRALGLTNIRYAQADVVHLPSLGRSFDVIKAVGVLHHLADLWDGWKILLALLRPGGVMRIGLYSALGRRNVAQAQGFARAGNYEPDLEGIRACRRNLLRYSGDTPMRQVIDFSDFYSTSQCRNLLFQGKEQHVTLPQIAAFLAKNDLAFLGFDAPVRVIKRYSQDHTHDGAMSDLSSWHQFETENPDTFARLYDFWVQKA